MPENEKYEKLKNHSNILTVDTVQTWEISTGYGKLSPDRRSERSLSAREPGSTTGYSYHCSLFDRNPKNMVAEKKHVYAEQYDRSRWHAPTTLHVLHVPRTLRSKSIRELAKRFARYYPPRQLRLANALAFNDPDTLALVFPLNRRNIVITTYFS